MDPLTFASCLNYLLIILLLFRFTSNFDSGNLARVEIKSAEEQTSVEDAASNDLCRGEAEAISQESVVSGQPLPRPSTSSTLQFRSAGIESPEVEFQVVCHINEEKILNEILIVMKYYNLFQI